VNGTIHAAAAEQRRVGGIDDGIDIQRGDVGLDDGDGIDHDRSLANNIVRQERVRQW
jgi:hypothetical protein